MTVLTRFARLVFPLAPTLAVALALATQIACAPSGPEATLNNYLARLSRALGNDTNNEGRGDTLGDSNGDLLEKDQGAEVRLPPRAESLQRPIEQGSLDGLDFLRLKGCALQTTIARRNSSLGRIAPPSQRLLLELAFLREAPACIERLRMEDKHDLAQLLAESADFKRLQLPTLIFNATLGNMEYRELWRSRGALNDYPGETNSRVLAALERINSDVSRWLGGDYEAEESAFELALSDVSRGDAGELLAALALQGEALETADYRVNVRLAEGPLCRDGLMPERAKILRTVVQKFFIGEVQPWSAALNQRYHELVPPVVRLEAQLAAVLPAHYLAWRDDREERMNGWLQGPRRHVRQLQALLGSCFAEFAPDVDANTGA